MHKNYYKILAKLGVFLLVGVVLVQTIFLSGRSRVKAVAYDADSNVWCGSDLDNSLNDSDSGFLSWLGDYANYIVTTNWTSGVQGNESGTTCSNRKIATISYAEWTAVKETYKTALGTTAYLPSNISYAWTRTPSATAGQAYAIDSSDGALASTAVATTSTYGALPTFYLDQTQVCVSDFTNGTGTAAAPYVLTTTNCDSTPPTISATNVSYGSKSVLTVQDTGSGVVGWQVTTTTTVPTSGWTDITNTGTTQTTINDTVVRDVGTYYAWAKDAMGNTAYAQFAISKYTPTVALGATSGSVAALSTKTFTATPTTISGCVGTLTATSASASYVTVSSDASTFAASASFSSAASGTAKTFTYKGVGYTTGNNVVVSYVPTSTANCNSAATKTFSAAVTRLTPTVSLTAKTATYSGSTVAANAATATYNSAAVTLSYTYLYYTDNTCATQTTTATGASATGGAPANAGTYYVKATSTATSVYASASSACTAHTISKKDLSWGTNPTVSNKVYNGNTAATISNHGAISGVISGDTCTLSTGSAAATFDTAAVGTDKTITLTGYTVAGTSCSNYGTLAQPTGVKANITVFTPTVNLTAKTATYTAAAIAANTATVSLTNSETYGGTITYTYYSSTDCSGTALGGAPTDAGNYSVKASIVAAGNYAAAEKCVTHTISKSDTTTTLAAKSTIYTGSAISANAASAKLNSTSATIAEAVFTYAYYSTTDCSGTALGSAPTNAGSYSAKATLTGTSNYNTSSACATHTITNAALSGSVKITGTNTYGQILTASVTNTNSATLAYQWYTSATSATSGGTEISGATSGTYTVGSGLVGKYIYVVVSASKANYTSTTWSDVTDATANTTATVARAAGSCTVNITGTNTYGSGLTATITTSSDGTKGYAWYSNASNATTGGTAISGATSNTYTIGSGLAGKYIYMAASVAQGTNYTAATCTDITDAATNTTATVARKAATMTVSPTTLSLTYPTADTITYTYDGDGTVTCSSSTGAATCSVNTSTKKVTVTPASTGTPVITVSAAQGTDYAAASKTVNTTISNGALSGGSVAITGNNTVGSTLTAAVSNTSPTASYSYVWWTASSASATTGTAITGATAKDFVVTSTQAGYYIGVTVTASLANYTDSTFNDITDATANKTATAKTAATIPTASYCKSLTYTGSAQTLTNTAGTGYTFSNNMATTAGAHTVTATLSTNYIWSDFATGTKTFDCSIAKAMPTLTLNPTSGSVNYNATTSTTATGSVAGVVSATSGNTTYATITSSNTTIAAGGSATVTIKGAKYTTAATTITVTLTPTDTDNYNSKTTNYSLTAVNKATPTVSLTAKETPYTGAAIAANTATSPIPGTFTYVYYTENTCTTQTTTATGAAATGAAPIDAATYYVKATLTPTDTTNYQSISSDCTSHKITPKSVAVVWDDDSSYVYQAGEDRPPVPTVASGVTGEAITLSRTTQTNVGTQYTSVASIASVTGGRAKAANYTLTNATKSAYDITMATPTVDLTAKSTAYTGSAIAANTATVTPATGGSLSYTYYSSTNCTTGELAGAPIDAGSYSVKATVAATANYNSASKCVTHTITAKSVAVTWGSTTTWSYDGSSHVPTASVTTGVNGETMTLTVTGEKTNASASSYTATAACASVTGGQTKCSNYTLSSTTKAFTINASATTTTLAAKSVTYTGSVIAANAASAKLNSNNATISGAAFTYAYYASTDCSGTALAGAPTDPGSYSAKATLTATTNYNTSSACATHTIIDSGVAITTQPGAVTVNQGVGGAFTVAATGTNLAYQWYSNSTNSTTGGTSISGANSASYTIAAEAMTTALNGKYYYVVVSNAADSKTSTPALLTVYGQPTAPTTFTASDGIACGAWHKSNFNLVISGSTLPGAGAIGYYYGTTNNPTTAGGTISVSTETDSTNYYARAYNTSAATLQSSVAGPCEVKLDKTAPAVTVTANEAVCAKVHTGTIKVQDTQSGLPASVTVSYGWSISAETAPTEWSTTTLTGTAGRKTEDSTTVTGPAENGLWYLWVKAGIADVAGNTSTAKTSASTICIDVVAPVLNVTPTASTTWNDFPVVQIVETGSSGLSTENVQEYYWSTSDSALTGGQWKTWNNGGQLNWSSGDPQGTVYLFVKRISDKAGNISTEKGTAKEIGGVTYQQFGSYVIDKTKPECSIALSGTQGDDDWYTGTVTGTLTYSDAGGSLVKYYDIATSVVSNSSNTKATLTDSTDGTGKKFYGYVKDGAGNYITCESETYKLDSAKPTASATDVVYGGKSTITLQDAQAGVVGWQVTGSATVPTTGWTAITNTGTAEKEVTDATVRNVGTYYAWAKDAAGNVSVGDSFTVADATFTGSVSISGTTTYGETLTAVTTAIEPQGTYTYKWHSSDTSATTGGVAISNANCDTAKTCKIPTGLVGKYIYVMVTASTNNYAAKDFAAVTAATVVKGTPTVALTAKSAAYTGHAIAANNASATYNGATVTLTYSYAYYNGNACGGTALAGAPTEVGTYSVKATSNATADLNSDTSDCVAHTITAVAPTLTLTDKTATYTGSTIDIGVATATGLTGGSTPAGTITYNYYSNDTCTTASAAHTNAGTYYAQASIAADGNYTATTSNCAKLTINKKAVTVTADSAEKVYDGTPLTKTTCTGNTLVSGHSVTCTMTAESTITNVGTQANTIATAVIKDAGNNTVTNNYTVTNANGLLEVTQLGVAKPTSASHCQILTYNGAVQTLTKTAGAGYVFSNNTGTAANTYEVTATLDGNHAWADASTAPVKFNCVIATRPITVTAKAQTITYGENIATGVGQVTYTATSADAGLVNGHSLDAITLTASTTNAGTGTILPSAATIEDVATTANYEIDYATGVLIINKKDITVTKTDYSGSYDGQPHTFTLTATPSANIATYYSTTTALTAANYTTAGSTTKPTLTNAGSVTVYYYIHDTSGNYNDYASNAKSNNATITLTKNGVAKPTAEDYCQVLTYTGAVQTLTKTAGVGYSFSDNTGMAADTYTVTATLDGDHAWMDSSVIPVTFNCTIAQKPITVTAKAQTIVYGNEITTGVNQVEVATLVSGQAVTAVTLTASRDTVGSGTITPSDATIKDNATPANDVTDNYAITYNTGALTITDSEVAITAQPEAVEVNAGTATSFSVTATGTNLTYQWYQNTTNATTGGTAIEGATSSTYNLAAANVTTAVNGKYYYVVVSNAADSKTSTAALLTVYDAPAPAPTITASDSIACGAWHKNNFTVNFGGSSVGAGAGSVTYVYGTTNNPTTVGTSVAVNEETAGIGYYARAYNTAAPELKTAVTGPCTVKLDKTEPVCGTWTSGVQNAVITMTLADSTDELSQIKTAGGSCTAERGGTCDVTIKDNAGNTKVCTSPLAINDETAPTLSLEITETSNDIYYDATHSALYYKTPEATQSFKVVADAADEESGVAKVTFPGISTTGFAPTTSKDVATSPYEQTYTIGTSAATSPNTQTVTAYNNMNLDETANYTITVDNTAPTGMTITCPTGFVTESSFVVTADLDHVVENGSGVNKGNSYLQVQNAALTGNACAATEQFANVGNPYATTVLQSPMPSGCYNYRYAVVDNVGNIGYSATCTVKVDVDQPTTAPNVVARVNDADGEILATVNGGTSNKTAVVYTTTPQTYLSFNGGADNNSDVAGYVYATTAGGNKTVGDHVTLTATAAGVTYYVYTRDNAGNDSVVYTAVTVKLASLAVTPESGTTYVDGDNLTAAINGYNYGTLSCASSVNTVATCEINEATSPATLVVSPVGVGETVITVSGTNADMSATYTATVKVMPTCTITKDPSDWAQETTLTVSSETEDLAAAPFSWTSATTGFSATTTKDVTANGTYTAWVKDQVGTVGSCSTVVDKVDRIAPTVLSVDDTIYSQEATVTAHIYGVTDEGSQVDRSTWSLWSGNTRLVNEATGNGSGTTQSYDFDLTDSGEGLYTVTGNVYDRVGNVTAWDDDYEAIQLYFDQTAPTGGSATVTTENIKMGVTHSLALTVNDGTDAVSGVNTTTRALAVRKGTLSDNTCGGYADWASQTYTGTYPNLIVPVTLAGDECYQYRWTVADRAGNQAEYLTDEVKVTYVATPVLEVTPPVSGEATSSAQDIMVTATVSRGTVSRIAYMWDTPVNEKCTDGHVITSGTNLKSTQEDGSHILYVCAASSSGGVSSYSDTYRYGAAPAMPDVKYQTTADNLYWNSVALNPLDETVKIPATYGPTGQVRNYEVTLRVLDDGELVTTDTVNVTTSTTEPTSFEFEIPISALDPSLDHTAIVGPQELVVKDKSTNETETFVYNVSFHFPIYQQTSVAVALNYIRVLTDTSAEIPTLQGFTVSDCNTWPTVTGDDYSNGYGIKSTNQYLAAYYLMDERDGNLYEVRKFADGQCWLVDNLIYGGGTGGRGDYCDNKVTLRDGLTAATVAAVDSNGLNVPGGTATLVGDCRENVVNIDYGYLYNWTAAVQDGTAFKGSNVQPTEPLTGICPTGWYLPTGGEEGDWADLANSGVTAAFFAEDGNFKNLFAGKATPKSSTSDQGVKQLYWASSQASAEQAQTMVFLTDGTTNLQGEAKNNAVSVRCIKK